MFQVEFIECVAAKARFPQQSGMRGCCGHSGQGRAHSCGDKRCCFPPMQEIDGKALLLLRSDMMMKYMGLKLGPALKLTYHIDKLKQGKF